jgi:hypothetical protein
MTCFWVACYLRAASTLLRRLEQTHATLMTVKHMLPAVSEAADALTAYELTHQSMQQFIVNTHTEWFNTIDNSISKQLQDNLLVQDKTDRKCQGPNFCLSWLYPCVCTVAYT